MSGTIKLGATGGQVLFSSSSTSGVGTPATGFGSLYYGTDKKLRLIDDTGTITAYTGYTGAAGTNGTSGSSGVSGNNGFPGTSGTSGNNGATGPSGSGLSSKNISIGDTGWSTGTLVIDGLTYYVTYKDITFSASFGSTAYSIDFQYSNAGSYAYDLTQTTSSDGYVVAISNKIAAGFRLNLVGDGFTPPTVNSGFSGYVQAIATGETAVPGTSGVSGSSGSSGSSGQSGAVGSSGSSGSSGQNGSSGSSGQNGSSGSSGSAGTSGNSLGLNTKNHSFNVNDVSWTYAFKDYSTITDGGQYFTVGNLPPTALVCNIVGGTVTTGDYNYWWSAYTDVSYDFNFNTTNYSLDLNFFTRRSNIQGEANAATISTNYYEWDNQPNSAWKGFANGPQGGIGLAYQITNITTTGFRIWLNLGCEYKVEFQSYITPNCSFLLYNTNGCSGTVANRFNRTDTPAQQMLIRYIAVAYAETQTPGSSGSSGSSGFSGSSGSAGTSGATFGTSGSSGSSGSTGSSGSSGSTGSSGSSGSSGTRGSSGSSGSSGQTGSSGTSGSSSFTINNNVSGYVVTGSGTSGVVNGQSSLTFGGTNLLISGIYVGKGGATGSSNVVIGDGNTLSGITPASANIAIGYSVLTNAISAGNVGIGLQALQNHTGSNGENVAIGQYPMTSLTTGYQNIGLGRSVMSYLTTGYQNIGLGYNAGGSLTSGIQNTLIGHNTGQNITTGSKNTVLGANINATNVSNNIILGDGDGTIRMQFDNTGAMSLPNTTAIVTAAAGASDKYLPISINGVTYKLLLHS